MKHCYDLRLHIFVLFTSFSLYLIVINCRPSVMCSYVNCYNWILCSREYKVDFNTTGMWSSYRFHIHSLWLIIDLSTCFKKSRKTPRDNQTRVNRRMTDCTIAKRTPQKSRILVRLDSGERGHWLTNSHRQIINTRKNKRQDNTISCRNSECNKVLPNCGHVLLGIYKFNHYEFKYDTTTGIVFRCKIILKNIAITRKCLHVFR